MPLLSIQCACQYSIGLSIHSVLSPSLAKLRMFVVFLIWTATAVASGSPTMLVSVRKQAVVWIMVRRGQMRPSSARRYYNSVAVLFCVTTTTHVHAASYCCTVTKHKSSLRVHRHGMVYYRVNKKTTVGTLSVDYDNTLCNIIHKATAQPSQAQVQ